MAKKKFEYVRLEVDKVDLDLIQNKLKKLRKFSTQEFSNEVGAWALNTSRTAKERVPRDTGTLKRSIRARRNKNVAEVEAGAKYAPYIEFGTGGKNVDLSELRELGIPEIYAMQFKGKKDGNLPARPYLFNSARYHLGKMIDSIQRKLKNIVK